MTKDILARVVAVVAIVIAIIGCFTPGAQQAVQKAGQIYDTFTGDYFVAARGMTTGANGTAITRLNVGQCYIQPYAATIAASSTASVDCQANPATGGLTTANDTNLKGVSFGDNVLATLSTTTAGTLQGGIDIIGVSASTTAGRIVLTLANTTGTTFTWPTTGSASGTASYEVSSTQ